MQIIEKKSVDALNGTNNGRKHQLYSSFVLIYLRKKRERETEREKKLTKGWRSLSFI